MAILPLCYATACDFCSLSRDDVAYCNTRPGFYGLDLERRFIITWSQMGAVTLTVLRPPCWTVHVTRVIDMFTCRSLVLRMDKSWKDSAFMALGFCLHHSVGVMWSPHQLNEPFSYFWWAILVPWYSSLFAERLPFPAHIPWFFPGCSWFLFQLLHPTKWKCYIIES